MLYFLGDPNPVAIRAQLTKLNRCEGDTTNMRFENDPPLETAFVEFDNGTTLHQVNAAIRAEYEIICEKGLIRTQNDAEALYVRKSDGGRNSNDPIEVDPVEHFCGTERKVRELVDSIRTGKPGVSNLRATMIGTEIGFGFYESHLQGGAVVRPPVPNRSRWVASW